MVAANEAMGGLVGRPAVDLIGRAFEDLAPLTPGGAGRLLGLPSPPDAWLRHEDGHSVHVRVTTAVLGAGPPPVHIVYLAPSPDPLVDERVFQHAPIGMATFDESYRFTRANAALAALLDASPADLLGRPYTDFLHPEELAAARSRMAAAGNGSLNFGQTERQHVTASGRHIWLRAAGLRVKDAHAATFFGIFLDVTDRHLADAERARLQEQVLHAERLRTIGQIAAGFAHEINNPAAVAVGGAEIARRRLTAAGTSAKVGDLQGIRRHLESLDSALRYCEDGTLRIAQAARRLGSFASLHGGEVQVIDPNEAVRRAVELVRNELRHRARLVIELGASVRLVADADRLVQALTNLLVNAGQATEGSPDAHTITVRTWAADGAFHILVADTGVGMSRDVRDRIFEPFFSRRNKDRGTGLGLVVVNDVVRQHRGRVDVWTEPGAGSRFTLVLPFENGLTGRDVAPRSGRRRILVVDDEPSLLAVLEELLSADHDVVVAPGGREAIAILQRDTRFDAVLCDLMMPGTDGIDVHEALRERAPRLAATTVFCTGGAFTERASTYLANAGLPVLAKPFNLEDVRRALDSALTRGVARG